MEIDGADLRAARLSAQVSLRHLAELIGRSAGHISQIETGKRPITPADVARYERALGTRIGTVDRAAEAATVEDVRRRDFIGLVASASVGAAAPQHVGALLEGLTNPELPSRVGLAEVQAIEESASLYMRMDLAHGGGMAVQMGKGSLQWASGLLKQQMSDPIRQRLSTAVALLADRVGWSAYDAGDSRNARQLLLWSLDHAARGADRDLKAHVMLDLSSVLTDAGSPHEGVDVLRLALGDERLSSAERANLHAVCARHCGTAGERQSGLRHIGLSDEAQANPYQGYQPEWARRVTLSAGHHHSAVGLALFELREDARAFDRLTSALNHLDSGRTRTGLRCRTRLAILNLRMDDHDEGERQARQALADANGVRSRRVRSDLRMVAHEADRVGRRDLADALRS